MHCAFINFKFVPRNHLLPSLHFAAQCWAMGCRRAGEPAWRVVLCTSYSASVLLLDRHRAGRSGGHKAAIWVHNGVALYDGTPWRERGKNAIRHNKK
jgi:hypothetical protein